MSHRWPDCYVQYIHRYSRTVFDLKTKVARIPNTINNSPHYSHPIGYTYTCSWPCTTCDLSASRRRWVGRSRYTTRELKHNLRSQIPTASASTTCISRVSQHLHIVLATCRTFTYIVIAPSKLNFTQFNLLSNRIVSTVKQT